MSTASFLTPPLVLGVGVASSLLASGLSSAVSTTSIGVVSADRRLAITPRGGAFRIWFPIYLLLISSVVYAAQNETQQLTPAVLIAAAELLSALWVPLFLANTRASLLAAAATLVAAAAAAVMAVFRVQPAFSLAAPWGKTLCVDVSFALFAGWLCCAAVLGIGIAVQSYGVVTPRWVLLLLAAGVAALAIASRNPVLPLPCLWALAWQAQVSAIEVSGVVACAGAAALALLRQ